jgi:hypothetical protein
VCVVRVCVSVESIRSAEPLNGPSTDAKLPLSLFSLVRTRTHQESSRLN